MKKILIILLSALSLTAFAQQKKVAVYVTGEQSGVSKVLGDQLVAAFAKSGKYTAVERTSSFLAELSKEQSYQRSGAVNDRDIARIGSQFGVNYVCVTDISDVFGEKYVSARLIDVENAEVIKATNASGSLSSMDELLTLASNITNEFTGPTEQEKAQEAAYQQALRKENELKKTLAQGYIKMGSLYVTSSVTHETWNEAQKKPRNCRAGGWNDWRLPSALEVARIKNNLDQYNTGLFKIEAEYLSLYHSDYYYDIYYKCFWVNEGYGSDGEKKCYNKKTDSGLLEIIGYVILVRGY